jgi:hypothetical protein
MTDGYSMLAQDVDFRQEVSEKLGTGFDVPASMTPTTPRKKQKCKAKVHGQVLVSV